MQTNTETITAARVRAEYDKGVQFNNGLNLYEDVKQCENFVERPAVGRPEDQDSAADHDERT